MNKKALISLLAVSAVFSSHCSFTDKETQLTLGLASETEIPKELDSFTIHVFSTRTGELRFSQDYSPSSGKDFPTTLAVIPADKDSLGSPLRVELEGRKGSQSKAFLKRTAVISYIEGRNILLNMPLRMACFQFQDCGPNSTCAGGECVPAEVDATKLPTYDDGIFFPKEGTCFDEERCLKGAEAIAVNADCTFSLPTGLTDTQGNVGIQWAAAPARLLALESGDRQEGWVRLTPGRGRLSQGACDSHFQVLGPDGQPKVKDWAKQVLFSSTCASKVATVPYCVSKATGHSGIGALLPYGPGWRWENRHSVLRLCQHSLDTVDWLSQLTFMLRPIPPRQGAAKACADQLRDAIVRGELAVGSRLPPERTLAETLGVNRATVRIALHELEATGLVTARQGSGYAVRNFQEEGGPDLLGAVADVARDTGSLTEMADDLLLVRRELARAVLARLGTRKLSRAALATLDERVHAFEVVAASAGPSIEECAAADFAVLACILDLIGSPVLRLFLNPAMAVLARVPELAHAMYATPQENAAAWRFVITLAGENAVDVSAIVAALESQDHALLQRLTSQTSKGAS